ncbi:putative flippase AglR [uncultured archaeon]|nr:putative flippase AglR [uncultured archaeon]
MKNQERLNHLLKVFVKSSVILLFGIILSKILTYTYRIVIARNFGQETYGLFSLALMIATLFVTVFSLGLQSGLLRYISLYRGKEENEKIKSILTFSSNLTLIVSLLAAGLLFFLSKTIAIDIFHNQNLIIYLQGFAIFLPIFIFSGFFHVITLSYEKVGWYSFIGNILSPLIQLLFLVIFIFMGLKDESIIFSYNLGFLAILLSAFLVCNYGIKKIFEKSLLKKEEKNNINKKLFSYSWPIMFLGLTMSLFSWIDSFLIGYFKTASDVGIYNVAFLLASFLLVVPALFLQIFLPIITKEYANNNFGLIKDLSKQIGKWIFILNLPLLIIMILFPGAIINLLFGTNYIFAENSLRFLSIGVFVYSILQISENLLSMIGKSKRILFNLIVATIFNTILNFILIPNYGINGAAFSTMISYILWGILSLFTAKHFTNILPLRWDMIKIILISLIPTIILLYFRSKISLTTWNIILLGIFFLVSYFGIMILTKCFDKNDLMIIQTIKNKISKK